MIKQTLFFLVIGSMIIGGLLFNGKYLKYPSALERKNKVLRAVKTGLSNTVLGVGLLLLSLYWESRETFWTQWTFSSIRVGILLTIALFLIMTIGTLIQFYSW